MTGSRDPYARMGIAIFSLMGVFLSGYLTLYHAGGVVELQCGLGGGCNVVQASEYAYFAGIPVAAWGLGGYAALFALAMVGVRPGPLADRRISFGLFGLAAIALLFSAYLTYLEAAVIHAWCQWCVISAIFVTIIFGFAVVDLVRARRLEPSATS